MKMRRIIYFVLGIAILAIFCAPFAQYAKREEASRMSVAERILSDKLLAYFQANRHFPNSIDALLFTNTEDEIQALTDVRKISYQCLDDGLHYGISYRGFWGYRISAVSNNFRKTEPAFQHLNATNQSGGN
jgi:hypothetical protein